MIVIEFTRDTKVPRAVYRVVGPGHSLKYRLQLIKYIGNRPTDSRFITETNNISSDLIRPATKLDHYLYEI